MQQGSQKKKMWKFLQTVELLTKIIDISNICVFFINGVFPSLLYRLLDVRTVRYAHCYIMIVDQLFSLS
jgi:Pex2 / Pex12 amino terminal region